MSSPDPGELLERAILARRQDRLADAYRDANEALLRSRESRDQDCLIRALRMLGQLERDEGRPERALPHYREAIDVCRAQGGKLRLAHATRHLGDLLVELNDFDSAAIEYEAALAAYRQEPSRTPLDLANALRAIAVLKQKLGGVRVARPFWEEARSLYSAENVESGVAECDLQLDQSNE